MDSRGRVTALTAVCVAATTACSTPATAEVAQTSPAAAASSAPTTTSSSTSPSVLTLDDGTTVLVDAEYTGDISDVGHTGEITTVDGSCLGFDDGLSTQVLVLPHGSSVAADGLGVVTPQGVTWRVGDTISGSAYGAGGGTSLEAQWKATLPECFAERSGIVVIA